MHKSIFVGTVISMVFLASGCSLTSLVDEPVTTCAADSYQYLVGLDMEVLDTTLMPANTRIIEPDDLVTQDYSAARINVTIGNSGIIDRVYCG